MPHSQSPTKAANDQEQSNLQPQSKPNEQTTEQPAEYSSGNRDSSNQDPCTADTCQTDCNTCDGKKITTTVKVTVEERVASENKEVPCKPDECKSECTVCYPGPGGDTGDGEDAEEATAPPVKEKTKGERRKSYTKPRSDYMYKIGDQYPAITGHERCYIPVQNVPHKMGWLWDHYDPQLRLKVSTQLI